MFSSLVLNVKRLYQVQCQNVSDCILNEPCRSDEGSNGPYLLEVQEYHRKTRHYQVEQWNIKHPSGVKYLSIGLFDGLLYRSLVKSAPRTVGKNVKTTRTTKIRCRRKSKKSTLLSRVSIARIVYEHRKHFLASTFLVDSAR